MGNRAGQLNMPHTLSPYFGERDFYATFLADDATVLHALVLTAQTLVIFDGAKYFGAEQSVSLGLKGPVIDSFGLFYFPERPRPHHVRRCQPNPNTFKITSLILGLQ